MPEVFTDNKLRSTALPKNSNLINYSVLNEYYSPAPFRSFSIKYVVEGAELYSVNGTKHNIRNKEYLLANKFSEGYVEVNSKKAVKGICIDVAPTILSEVVSSYRVPGTSVCDPELDKFFNSPSFFENKYKAGYSNLGQLLLQLESQFEKDPAFKLNLNQEFYYDISERILMDHIPVYKQLQSIRAIKPETKKELYRKLLRAREYMDTFFLNSLKIEEIAAIAGLSEYHFFRLHKAVFEKSPLQYLLKKRMDYALHAIKNEGASVTEAALICGFSDIQSFSKAFKKWLGFSPSTLLLKNSRL